MDALKPKVLIARRAPVAVVEKLSTHFDVDFHDGQAPLSADELRTRLQDKPAPTSQAPSASRPSCWLPAPPCASSARCRSATTTSIWQPAPRVKCW